MKRIKVLRIKAHCYPEIVRILLGLDSLQKEVGGPIQAVYPWDDPVALICNEEGKLDSDAVEHYNRVLATEIGVPYDIVVGTFLIVGLTEDDFGSLSPELLERIILDRRAFRIGLPGILLPALLYPIPDLLVIAAIVAAATLCNCHGQPLLRVENIHLCFVGSALGPFLRYFFIQKLSSTLFPAFRAKDSRYRDIFQLFTTRYADFVSYRDTHLTSSFHVFI